MDTNKVAYTYRLYYDGVRQDRRYHFLTMQKAKGDTGHKHEWDKAVSKQKLLLKMISQLCTLVDDDEKDFNHLIEMQEMMRVRLADDEVFEKNFMG